MDSVWQVPFGDAVNISGESDALFEYSVDQQAVTHSLLHFINEL